MAYGNVVISDLAACAAILLDSLRLFKSSLSSTNAVACLVAPICSILGSCGYKKMFSVEIYHQNERSQ